MSEQDRHYVELYERLLERGEAMHANNKKRIRVGLILLGLLPVILIIIRLLTDSDRVVFLIIWVLCMFAVCIYLISIEFIDDSLRKTLEDVTEKEADFGVLIPDSAEVRNRIHEHVAELVRSGYTGRPYNKVVERTVKLEREDEK
jgi:hypothetical protein